jgi:hypothetical protein
MLDLGYYHIATKENQCSPIDFLTVQEGSELYIYESPGGSKKDIREAIAVAFIDGRTDWDDDLDYKVTGRYPNYQISESEKNV